MEGIYKITNLDNKKVYIGQSNNISGRKRRHFNDLNKQKHHNKYLQRAWNKYGQELFSFEMIEEINGNDLRAEREDYWINYYKSYNSKYGYNLDQGSKNSVISDIKRKKLSKALKGKPKSLEHRKSLSEAGKGRIVSAETRKKLSEAGKCWKRSNEMREKCRLAATGRKHTDKAKEKISEANHNRDWKPSKEHIAKLKEINTGRKHTDETKKKISEKNLGHKWTEEQKRQKLKLDDDTVIAIIESLKSNNVYSVSKQFGVSRNLVNGIKADKTYNHISRY